MLQNLLGEMKTELEDLEGYDELVSQFLAQLPPERRLEGLDPKQRLAGLDPEQLQRLIELARKKQGQD